MKRQTFLLVAGLLACAFGLGMMLSPASMLTNMTTGGGADAARVLRWAGTALFSIGIITFFSRNDPGSSALKAVMVGNVMIHALAMSFDIADHLGGFVNKPGIIMGSIVHLVIGGGFIYYLVKKPAQ